MVQVAFVVLFIGEVLTASPASASIRTETSSISTVRTTGHDEARGGGCGSRGGPGYRKSDGKCAGWNS